MSEPVVTPENAAPEAPETAAQPPKEVDWEAEARKWEKRSKDNFAKLKEAEPKLAELDQIKAANQTEAERLATELNRWQTEAEQWRSTAVGSRIQALASEFADPSDAVTALADKNYLDAGGQIDDAAIQADLVEVLTRKPHWRRATDQGPRLPAPNAAQGTGGTPVSDPAAAFASIIQGQLRS